MEENLIKRTNLMGHIFLVSLLSYADTPTSCMKRKNAKVKNITCINLLIFLILTIEKKGKMYKLYPLNSNRNKKLYPKRV